MKEKLQMWQAELQVEKKLQTKMELSMEEEL